MRPRDMRPAAKDALTQQPLERMLDTCTDGLIGVRDRALLLIRWSSGEDVASKSRAPMNRGLTRVGPGRYVYTGLGVVRIVSSKTDQEGRRTDHRGRQRSMDFRANRQLFSRCPQATRPSRPHRTGLRKRINGAREGGRSAATADCSGPRGRRCSRGQLTKRRTVANGPGWPGLHTCRGICKSRAVVSCGAPRAT